MFNRQKPAGELTFADYGWVKSGNPNGYKFANNGTAFLAYVTAQAIRAQAFGLQYVNFKDPEGQPYPSPTSPIGDLYHFPLDPNLMVSAVNAFHSRGVKVFCTMRASIVVGDKKGYRQWDGMEPAFQLARKLVGYYPVITGIYYHDNTKPGQKTPPTAGRTAQEPPVVDVSVMSRAKGFMGIPNNALDFYCEWGGRNSNQYDSYGIPFVRRSTDGNILPWGTMSYSQQAQMRLRYPNALRIGIIDPSDLSRQDEYLDFVKLGNIIQLDMSMPDSYFNIVNGIYDDVYGD